VVFFDPTKEPVIAAPYCIRACPKRRRIRATQPLRPLNPATARDGPSRHTDDQSCRSNARTYVLASGANANGLTDVPPQPATSTTAPAIPTAHIFQRARSNTPFTMIA